MNDMTDQEINQRIARALPDIHPRMDKPGCSGNYTGDLNAAHEAEQGLTPDQWQIYFDLLVQLVAGSAENPRHADYPKVVHATARQRAESVLRTLGKWEDA